MGTSDSVMRGARNLSPSILSGSLRLGRGFAARRNSPAVSVKWFNSSKGYGFIQWPEGPKDVFVHYSAVKMEGYKVLDEGQPVEFAVEDSSKGPQAIEVVPLS